MTDKLVCWKCGASIAGLPLPLGRLTECPACQAELHVCLMCQYYDPSVSQSCREPIAEEVKEKRRANFCGYFQPNPRAYQPKPADAEATAQSELESLFGDQGSESTHRTKSGAEEESLSEEELAKKRLDDLFG